MSFLVGENLHVAPPTEQYGISIVGNQRLHVAGDAVYAVMTEFDGTTAKIAVAKSTDGETWALQDHANAPAPLIYFGVLPMGFASAERGGVIYTAYISGEVSGDFVVSVARFSTGSDEWMAGIGDATTDHESIGVSPHIAVRSDGDVLVSFTLGEVLSYSRYESGTWTRDIMTGVPAIGNAIVVDDTDRSAFVSSAIDGSAGDEVAYQTLTAANVLDDGVILDLFLGTDSGAFSNYSSGINLYGDPGTITVTASALTLPASTRSLWAKEVELEADAHVSQVGARQTISSGFSEDFDPRAVVDVFDGNRVAAFTAIDDTVSKLAIRVAVDSGSGFDGSSTELIAIDLPTGSTPPRLGGMTEFLGGLLLVYDVYNATSDQYETRSIWVVEPVTAVHAKADLGSGVSVTTGRPLAVLAGVASELDAGSTTLTGRDLAAAAGGRAALAAGAAPLDGGALAGQIAAALGLDPATLTAAGRDLAATAGVSAALSAGSAAYEGQAIDAASAVLAALGAAQAISGGAGIAAAAGVRSALLSGHVSTQGAGLVGLAGVAAELAAGATALDGQALRAAVFTGVAALLTDGAVPLDGSPLAARAGVAAGVAPGQLAASGAGLLADIATGAAADLAAGELAASGTGISGSAGVRLAAAAGVSMAAGLPLLVTSRTHEAAALGAGGAVLDGTALAVHAGLRLALLGGAVHASGGGLAGRSGVASGLGPAARAYRGGEISTAAIMAASARLAPVTLTLSGSGISGTAGGRVTIIPGVTRYAGALVLWEATGLRELLYLPTLRDLLALTPALADLLAHLPALADLLAAGAVWLDVPHYGAGLANYLVWEITMDTTGFVGSTKRLTLGNLTHPDDGPVTSGAVVSVQLIQADGSQVTADISHEGADWYADFTPTVAGRAMLNVEVSTGDSSTNRARYPFFVEAW